MKRYLKYYWLEKDYLETKVQPFFAKNHHLTAKHFFAIVIWKRNASKTKIKNALIKSGKDIEKITRDVFKEDDPRKKLNLLKNIDQIGIPIASAILTICYPNDFTVVDYRARTTLKHLGEKITGDPTTNISAYFEYLKKCKKLANKHNLSLRNFDRILWAKDWVNDLKGLVGKYNKKIKD